jgi:hypothetical protein
MQIFKNLILAASLTGLFGPTVWADHRACADLLQQNIPIIAQSTDFTCGTACLNRVFLYWYGWSPGEMVLARRLGSNALTGANSFDIVMALRQTGFHAEEKRGATVADLIRYLRQGETVYVSWLANGSPHFSLVRGLGLHHITLMDPWFARENVNTYNQLPLNDFVRDWAALSFHVIRIGRSPLSPL